MKQRENAGVAFGCKYRDGSITPVNQCFVGFSMENTVSIRSIMLFVYHCPIGVPIVLFFFYSVHIWEFKEFKAELTGCDCRGRSEIERNRGCSGRGSWAVCA